MHARLLLLAIALAVASGCHQDQGDAGETTQRPRASETIGEPLDLDDVEKLREDLRPQGMAGSYVYKGKRVKPGTFMAVVGITRGADPRPICTGILIEADIVLTAAHCICDHATSNVYVGDDAKLTKEGHGYYGILKWESAGDCKDLPGGELETRNGLDLAVLRTRRPIVETTPMLVAAVADIDRVTSARVVGFGAIDSSGRDFRHEKREASVEVLSSACLGHRSGQNDAVAFGCHPGNEMVAGIQGGPDTCSGDSGGPLLIWVEGDSSTTTARSLRVAGVTSRPVRGAATECGGGGIYERLTPFALGWIGEAIQRIRLH